MKTRPWIKPPALEAGSVIGVAAPASPVQAAFVEKGLEELVRLGFRTRPGTFLYERHRYKAGTAQERFTDLMELWENPEVDAIFCARGGYGTLDLLERLDGEHLRAHPKILLGSSDVTALLCFVTARSGLVCFHGPMVAQQIARGEQAYDSASLLAVMRAKDAGLRVGGPHTRAVHPGSAEGTLWGGCLSLVSALVGTPYLPVHRDAIIFLEDTGVKPYQIERMLAQIRLAGVFEGVKGVVFGEMPDCRQHPDQEYEIEELLADLTSGLGVPVVCGLPSGHTLSPARTLPLGVRVRLDHRGIELLEGAVR